jgi:hypothetical protein
VVPTSQTQSGSIEMLARRNRDRLSYLAVCVVLASASLLFLGFRDYTLAAVFGGAAIVVLVLVWRPDLNPGRVTMYRRKTE